MPRYAWGIAAVLLAIIAVAIGVFAGMQLSGPSQVVFKIVYIGEPVTIALPPEEKAEVAHESGARIVVPAGAVAEETTVSVAEVEPPTGALEVDRAYDFSVGDAELLEAVTVHIPFELDERQDVSGIYALHWNEDEGDWEPVSGTVDESAGTIAVETPSLSIFSWAWIKVDATCETSPATVDAGQKITISSKGTSLTRHDVNIYMRPDIKWEFEGNQYPHDPDGLTQIKSIGQDDQFELTYQSTLDAEGIYLIQCRLFWETVGPDVEFKTQDAMSARVTARGVVNWGTGHVRPPLVSSIVTPSALSHSGGPVVVEFSTEDRGTAEIAAPTVEVSFVTPIFQEPSQPCGVTEEGGLATRCWRIEITMPANTGPFDLSYDVTVTSEQIPNTLTGAVTVGGNPSAVVEIFDVEENSIIQATNVACSDTDLFLVLWVRVPDEERPPYYVAGRLDAGVGNSIAHLHPLIPPKNREAHLAVSVGFTAASIIVGAAIPGAGVVISVAGTALSVTQYLVEAEADRLLEEMLLGNYVEARFGEWPQAGLEQGFLVHVRSAVPVEEYWELSMTSSWAEAAEVTVSQGAATPVFCEVGAMGPDAPGTESAENTTTTPATATGTTSTSSGPTAPVPGSADSDRAALVTFYNATNGLQWRDNTNWLSEAPLHQWYGVETDTTGRVMLLSLSDNWVDGEIPPELGNLSKLRRLDLDGNLLSGKIPAELGNLPDLKWLELDSNQLSGGIPAELVNLARLKSLWLHSNQLTGGIPAELGDLINLETITLSDNQLSGEIPAEFGNLANLESINLERNQLTGEIPGELNKLKLWGVWLTGNQFTGCTPPRFEAALSSDLHNFGLPYCEGVATITSGPAKADQDALVAISRAAASRLGVFTNSSGRVIALNIFVAPPVGGGGPGGHISEQLRRLTSLESLSVVLSHRLRGRVIPPSLGQLTNLKELSISSHSGLRLIPAELGNLTNLEYLYLHHFGDGFIDDGSIPAELGNLVNLRELHIISNPEAPHPVRGAIPPELGKLTNLEVLRLSGSLSGGIPVELGNLTNLRELDLGRNRLTGEIPRELANLANLETLSLSGNQLTGCLPATFDGLLMSEFEAMGLPFCLP